MRYEMLVVLAVLAVVAWAAVKLPDLLKVLLVASWAAMLFGIAAALWNAIT